MKNDPSVPAGFVPDSAAERCPKCGWHGLAKIQTQKRCGQCGHQWGLVPQAETGPTRREILNGARVGVPRIIRWR